MKNNRRLNDPQATREAVKLFDYICSMEGRGILSGQQEDPRDGYHGNEMRYVKSVTGRFPAIRGLDYMSDDFVGANRRAKNWWKRGGIVTICWHWGTPPNGLGYPSSKETIDVEEALTPGTELNLAMLARIDEVAEALKELQTAHIPVLFRPLHEFDGAWFWWGKGGPDCFIRLWRLIHDRLVNEHELHNLIWVLGYSGEVKKGWYPGDEYCDIVGADTYAEGTHRDMYERVHAIVQDKCPICYHENGPLPDPEQLQQEKTNWSWFMTWHTIHIKEQNTREYLNYVYNHDYVITLDKLPKLV